MLAALVAGRCFADSCDVAPSADDAERAARGVRALLLACARGLVMQVELPGGARRTG